MNGLKDLYGMNVMHRDLKLENILITFPDDEILGLNSNEMADFIKKVDLNKTRFSIKIADLGFAK